jgi:predicted RNA binding protein YcfA (HicA-like mRNA interferase family)
MKLPRDLTGTELVKALRPLGYRVTRQTGSHIRLTCDPEAAPHHCARP